MNTANTPFSSSDSNFDAFGVRSRTEINDAYDMALGHIKNVMGVVNSTAHFIMMDAIDQIRKTPLFKGKVKYFINSAIKSHSDYERRLRHGNAHGQKFFHAIEDKKNPGSPLPTDEELFDWFLDIGACAYQKTNKELEMLRLQILQIFTKHDIEYKVPLSYVCVATSILEYSTCVFDELIRQLDNNAKRTAPLFTSYYPLFEDFRMTKVYYNFRQASLLLGHNNKNKNDNIDLNQSENVRLAFTIFEKAIMHDVNNAISADEAIELNKNLLSDECYKEYRREYDEAAAEKQRTA